MSVIACLVACLCLVCVVYSPTVPADDRPGEPQLLSAAVREPQGDSCPGALPRRSVAAGAGCGREGTTRESSPPSGAASPQL